MSTNPTTRRQFITAASVGGAASIGYAATMATKASAPMQAQATRDFVSAADFGALGDGKADDTAALQAWLNAGLDGATIRLPAGIYRTTKPLSGRVAKGAQHLAIIGDGAANTEILCDGDVNEPGIRLIGNMPDFDNLVVKGLRVTRQDRGAPGLGRGPGLLLENFRNFSVEDVRTFRNGIGIHLIGCLVGNVSAFLSYYDRRGLKLEQGPYLSTPNVIALWGCSILASLECGVEILRGTMVSIRDTTIEGTGVENPAANSVGLLVVDSGHAGGVAVEASAVYFEDNRGTDIDIRHGERPAIYRFGGCTFNRAADHRTKTNILFEARSNSADATLDVRGSSFMGYGVEYVTDARQPCVSFNIAQQYTGLTFLDDGVLYQHDAERPQVPPAVNNPKLTGVAGRILANGTVDIGRGIASAEWIATGYCEIRFTGGSSGLVVNLTDYGSSVNLRVSGEADDALIVEALRRDDGAPANGNFYITGVYCR